MTERAKQTFESLSISMRFILPIMMALFLYNYTGDQNRSKESFQDIKDSQKTIWMKLDAVQTREHNDYDDILRRFANKGNINPEVNDGH